MLDASAQTVGTYLGLETTDGVVLHRTSTRADGPLPSLEVMAPDGMALRLEGELRGEQLEAVASLIQQAVATHFELTEVRNDLGRSRQELSLLFEFSQSVCRVDSVEEVVERFLSDVVRVLDAREGTFLGVDKEAKELKILCHFGSSDETVTGFRLPIGEGIAGQVALDGHPRMVNDPEGHPSYVPSVNPITNLICVPIRIGGEVVGVVSINDRRGGPFELSHLKLLSSLAQLGQVGLENARYYEQIRGMLFEIVDGLVKMMEERAPYRVGHSRRVARLSYSLGRQLQMSLVELERLYLASLIHDIAVQPEASARPTAPWADARSIEENEAEALDSAGLFRPSGLLSEALPGLGEHLERFDGLGHPRGITGEQISLQGRIIAVAHAFDLATHAPIRAERRAPLQALEQVRGGSGTSYDPVIVRAFERVYEIMRLDAWVPPAEPDRPWSSTPEAVVPSSGDE